MLAERGLGPALHAVFPGGNEKKMEAKAIWLKQSINCSGRLEEFICGHSMSWTEMRSTQFSTEIARWLFRPRLINFHENTFIFVCWTFIFFLEMWLLSIVSIFLSARSRHGYRLAFSFLLQYFEALAFRCSKLKAPFARIPWGLSWANCDQ